MNVQKRIQGILVPVDPIKKPSTPTNPESQDMEALAHELALSTPVRKAFVFCSSLGISIYSLLSIDVEGNDDYTATLAPAQYVRMIRSAAQLTHHELDKTIGQEPGFIESVESNCIDLLFHPVQLSLAIAQATRSSPYRLLKVLDQTAWHSEDQQPH